jgi:hypothetical protein
VERLNDAIASCDRPVHPGVAFCPHCGAAVAPSADTRQADPAHEVLSWDYPVPLLTNRFILRDLAIVLVVSLIIMQLMVLVVGFLAEGEFILFPPQLWLIVSGVFVGLFAISCLILLNRFGMAFTLDKKGAWYETGTREKKVNRVLMWVSIFARRPGALAAATRSGSGQTDGITWREVRRVTYHDGPRVITLSNSWRPVLRLYCPRDGYQETAAFVRERARYLEKKPRSRVRTERRPWGRYVLWAALSAAATIAASAWFELYYSNVPRFILLTGLLVLASGLPRNRLRAVLGVVAAIPGLYVLVSTVAMALEPIGSSLGLHYGSVWELDTAWLALSLLGMLGLLAMAAAGVVYGVRYRPKR